MTDNKLQLLGRCQRGYAIVGGVFNFYETHGLPLDIILHVLWDSHNALPSWVDLIYDMCRAGKPIERAFVSVEEAICDAGYPSDIKDQLVKRLHEFRNLAMVDKRTTGHNEVNSTGNKP